MSAIFSEDQQYRYLLIRHLRPLSERTVTFVMLNPSTADGTTDDPTVRRCMGYALRWGFARLQVVNLNAYRATDPRALAAVEDPVGPMNAKVVEEAITASGLVVCAWGTHATVERVRWFADSFPVPPHRFCALGFTKDGSPGHPLYARADAILTTYTPGAV